MACRRCVVGLCICLLCYTLAMFITDLGIVFALVGASGSSILGYLLPGMFFLKMESDSLPFTHYSGLKKTMRLANGPSRGGALLLVAVFAVIFVVANTVVLLNAFRT
eukprot:NODE_7450_length_455_cov_46.253695_g6615_i0.p1 GENE.NODE_7450_length_455_cov_46.253695_g6615_i0~~NODE_7450_length_455_cov_46.253695_g6615_i0.p1  ORF type:complete len:107 (+),score=17.38 NODE_7450_length_455_cov_46.253695_g6615_i0:115-435(+)